jgi:hypothetical protein
MKSARYGLLSLSLFLALSVLVGTGPALADLCCTVQKEKFDEWPQTPALSRNCNNFVLAQSFRPQDNFRLCKVWVILESATSGPQGATLRIQDGPHTTSEVFSEVSICEVDEQRWYEFDIPDIDVLAEQDYFIRVTGSVMWSKYVGGTDEYPRGDAYLNGNAEPPDDYWFITYTYEDCPQSNCSLTEESFEVYPLCPRLGNNGNSFVLAQSFVPRRDFPLCRVEVVLSQATQASEGEEATLSIREGPEATSPILTQSTINGVKAETWYTFVIDDYPLERNQEYYIRVTGNVLWWRYHNGNSYPRGQAYVDEEPRPDYDFWFKTCTYWPVSVEDMPMGQIPTDNYPNPFNHATTIRYELPASCDVNLTVYNPMGQHIRTMVDENQPAGVHLIHWDGRDDAGIEVSHGVYFYRLRAGAHVEVNKILYVK